MCWLNLKRRKKGSFAYFRFEHKTQGSSLLHPRAVLPNSWEVQTPFRISWKLRSPFWEESADAPHPAFSFRESKALWIPRTLALGGGSDWGRKPAGRCPHLVQPESVTLWADFFFCPLGYFISSRPLWLIAYIYWMFVSTGSHSVLPTTSQVTVSFSRCRRGSWGVVRFTSLPWANHPNANPALNPLLSTSPVCHIGVGGFSTHLGYPDCSRGCWFAPGWLQPSTAASISVRLPFFLGKLFSETPTVILFYILSKPVGDKGNIFLKVNMKS